MEGDGKTAIEKKEHVKKEVLLDQAVVDRLQGWGWGMEKRKKRKR